MKNTIIEIIRKDEDGNIVEKKNDSSYSFDSYEIPEGWIKLDNRPVIMKRVDDRFIDYINDSFDSDLCLEIEDFETRTGKYELKEESDYKKLRRKRYEELGAKYPEMLEAIFEHLMENRSDLINYIQALRLQVKQEIPKQ